MDTVLSDKEDLKLRQNQMPGEFLGNGEDNDVHGNEPERVPRVRGAYTTRIQITAFVQVRLNYFKVSATPPR